MYMKINELKNRINKLIREEIENDLIEYDIPSWAISALINGDNSGLSDEDEVKLNKFTSEVVSANGNANFILGDIEGADNLGFRHSNDIDNLGSDVYRLYIKPNKERIPKEDPFNKRLNNGEFHI